MGMLSKQGSRNLRGDKYEAVHALREKPPGRSEICRRFLKLKKRHFIARGVEESEMEKSELERFKKILESSLERMGQPLRKRDEIAIENAPDDIDRLQGVLERELAVRQLESNFSRIQSLKRALERIADGSYGTCAECEQEISPKRLQAVPWASCCVRCQEMADRERVGQEGEAERLLGDAA
jgi:DnaK suppressor protein